MTHNLQIKDLTHDYLINIINTESVAIIGKENTGFTQIGERFEKKENIFNILLNKNELDKINDFRWELYGYPAGFGTITLGNKLPSNIINNKIIISTDYYVIFTEYYDKFIDFYHIPLKSSQFIIEI
jgi:hypothetical protein